MIRKNRGYLILVFLTAVIVNACAVQGTPPPAFEAQPIAAGPWIRKADFLYIILDASSSMAKAYKLETARNIVAHFDQTMPPLDMMVALRSFGHDPKVSDKPSALQVNPQVYTPGILSGGVARVSRSGGPSPLERALADAADDLSKVKERIALIIISDGKEMDGGSLEAARDLWKAHENQLCIYTVQVGHAAAGASQLSRIAGIGSCGRALTAESLSTGTGMNAFVRDVLLAGLADTDGDGVTDDKDRCPGTARGVTVDATGCPLDKDRDGVPDVNDQCPDTARGVKVDTAGCPLDSDQDGVWDYQDQCPETARGVKVDPAGCPLDGDRDGVPDDKDQCPQTAPGTKVNDTGCPVPAAIFGSPTATGSYVFKELRFESGKSDLKPGAYPILNEIAEALKARPGLNVEIQGHTDNRGKREDNVNLSQKRAEAVKAYLVARGVDGERLAARGYGPDRPRATNKTAKGRAMNRRVEFKPLR